MSYQEHLKLDGCLKEIRHLLSHLTGEVAALEENYSQVLLMLKKAENVAQVDELTGLRRRGSFTQESTALLSNAKNAGLKAGVLMLDVDHFKKVNDQYGHATGDQVLKQVAQVIKRFESSNVIVGRLGGEEFAVTMLGNDAEIIAMAEMIRRSVERLHGITGGNIVWRVTLSVGTATSTNCTYELATLLERSDQALYVAKTKGRNQVRVA